MTTVNRQYPLPNKNHVVVDDIEAMRVAFGMIDGDVKNSETEIAELSERVSYLEDRAIHLSESVENSEIQNITPGGYIKVGEGGNNFECVGGGGDPGGVPGECSIKKSEANFDTSWGNFHDVSKNGMTIQQNSEIANSNETHIFVDEAEIENEKQLPKIELTNNQVIANIFAENNESYILINEIEPQIETFEVATNLNYGLVKVGTGIDVIDGVISVPNPSVTSNDEFGLSKIGNGLNIENGVISAENVSPATSASFGTVKLSGDFSINANEEMELTDMADASIIYKLSQVKLVQNGIADLEEKTLIYRAIVAEDLVIQFNLNFVPQADFTFVLEIVSDGQHLISFNELLKPEMPLLPINRGTTKIYFTKKLGVPYYEITVSKLEAPDPVLLTPANGRISSEFLMYAPNGGNWNPYNILKDSYSNFSDIKELMFEFSTLVAVDYVNYWSRANTIAMNEFILRGSNDGKNWTTLIYKTDEVVYGRVPTEVKGCFRYFNLKIEYTSDDNKPGGVMLFGSQIDNHESEIINLIPYMNSNSTAFATLTASKISSGTAANITDDDTASYMRITYSDDTTDTTRWIKYELATSEAANLLELNFRDYNTQANWFKLEGSSDDEAWDLLLERQYQGNEIFNNGYRILYYHLNNETEYKFYRLTCVATNDSSANWDLTGFKLYKRQDGKWNFYRGIPKLTTATQEGYEVSASSEYNSAHAAIYAFDGDTTTKWAISGNGVGAWLQLKLPSITVFNSVQIASRGDGDYITQAPRDFEIQASIDGETWETLSTQTNISWTQGEHKTFTFENETAYLYYRLYINANNGAGDTGLGEFVIGNSIHEYKRLLHQYNSVVPILVANSDQGYIATASSVFGGTTHPPYRVFDGNEGANHKWLSENNAANKSWLKIELPEAEVADVFSLQSPNESYRERAPKSFKIQGSNDDNVWADLVVETSLSWSGGQLRQWDVVNATAYKFYRVFILETNGGSLADIGNWGIYQKNTIAEY